MEEKRVAPNMVVTISYQLEIEGKKTPSWFSRPMRVNFVFGRDPLMPVIEQAISGAKEGDEITVTIPPEQAYGPYDKNLIQEIPLDQLKHPEQVKEGEYYQEVTPTGRQIMFYVLKKDDGKVVADFNHPAAGHNVIMKIKVDEVRRATAMDFAACDMRNCGGG
ncbi:MAG: hypothetical protein GXO20_06415 [Thermodesulfobacteria bacterium]|nr:hypothetical protein [Thermodesulfobacteriota bacterium]